MRDLNKVRSVIRENEQSGDEPRVRVYSDHKGIPTIATGFNLNRGDASEICQRYGIDYANVRAGIVDLTPQQALDLEEHVIREAEAICIRTLSEKVFSDL